jgi:phosphatidylglycerol:prolipoprotein diacylglycerol transferase
LALWQGGFSILGALLGSIIFLIPYLKYNKIEVKKFLAIVLIYLPLAQAIGRLGCLLVGCCHGANYEGLFSIVYTNNESLAPSFVSLHPTQLYSSLFYGLLFLVLWLAQRRKNDDLIIRTYFLSAALERFIMDFMRGDRQIVKNLFGVFFSSHQLIAMLIISFVLILIMNDYFKQNKFFISTRLRQ